MNDFRETKVVVGPARFSYLHVWEPVAIGEGVEKKYSVSLIIPKSDAKSVGLVKAAIQNALNAGIGSKFGERNQRLIRIPCVTVTPNVPTMKRTRAVILSTRTAGRNPVSSMPAVNRLRTRTSCIPDATAMPP